MNSTSQHSSSPVKGKLISSTWLTQHSVRRPAVSQRDSGQELRPSWPCGSRAVATSERMSLYRGLACAPI